MPDFDPFNDIADDDTPEPFAEQPAKAASRATFTSDSEGKLVVTMKGGAGFDAPWLVYHATSVDDALGVFQNDSAKLVTLMEKVQSASKFFGGLAPAKPSAGGGAPARPGNEAPAGVAEAPGPDWTYKTGVGKNGKTWKAWMPPRGSNENPVWL